MNLAAIRLALDVRTCSLIGAPILTDIPSIWKQAKCAALLMSRLAAEPRKK